MEKGNAKKAGEHWDGRLRVSSTYDESTFELLDKLSCACGVSRTTIQTALVNMCLQNEAAIDAIQLQYRQRSRFRIIPSRDNGTLKYVLAEKLKRA